MAQAGPSIRVRLGPDDGAEILQNRPPVAAALRGKTTAEALALLPLLLPICGIAQTTAALRAIEAARGAPALEATERAREVRLVGEQVAAIAWRLAIDWPNLLGRPPWLQW